MPKCGAYFSLKRPLGRGRRRGAGPAVCAAARAAGSGREHGGGGGVLEEVASIHGHLQSEEGSAAESGRCGVRADCRRAGPRAVKRCTRCYPAAVAEPLQARRGAGGTPGGVGSFFVGRADGGGRRLSAAATGAGDDFVLALRRLRRVRPDALPLLVGVAFLFYNGRSIVGWLLTAVGATIILAGVLMNMDVYFRQTSLFNTLMMLGLLFGGLGLVARSLRGPA